MITSPLRGPVDDLDTFIVRREKRNEKRNFGAFYCCFCTTLCAPGRSRRTLSASDGLPYRPPRRRCLSAQRILRALRLPRVVDEEIRLECKRPSTERRNAAAGLDICGRTAGAFAYSRIIGPPRNRMGAAQPIPPAQGRNDRSDLRPARGNRRPVRGRSGRRRSAFHLEGQICRVCRLPDRRPEPAARLSGDGELRREGVPLAGLYRGVRQARAPCEPRREVRL